MILINFDFFINNQHSQLIVNDWQAVCNTIANISSMNSKITPCISAAEATSISNGSNSAARFTHWTMICRSLLKREMIHRIDGKTISGIQATGRCEPQIAFAI